VTGVDYQVLFNIAYVIAGVFGGYVLNRIYAALDRIDADVRKFPISYVQKDDFNIAMREVKTDIRDGFTQVDRMLTGISDRISQIANK
jgi:hypothetical protein